MQISQPASSQKGRITKNKNIDKKHHFIIGWSKVQDFDIFENNDGVRYTNSDFVPHSYYLMCKARVLITSLHELSPDLMIL